MRRAESTVLALCVAVCVCTFRVHGYATGAPVESCSSLLPQHGQKQDSPSPYSVRVAVSGDEFIVTLTDDTNAAPFTGFLLQARNPTTSTVIGQFTRFPDSGAQTIACLLADNTVTHTDDSPKHSLQFTWNARGANLNGAYIYATVVQNVDTFWTDIRSPDLANVVNSPCSAVEIVSRQEWNARPPTSVQYLTSPVNMTFVHHSAGDWQCTDKQTCIEMVQSIQNLHMDVNGWADIGYSFLIGEDGRAYAGRGWNVVGAHTANYNTIALGFCVIGDYTLRLPNEPALNALQNLIACGVEQGYIIQDYEMFGHRDGRCTECPGTQLYNLIRTWPRYSFRPIPIYC